MSWPSRCASYLLFLPTSCRCELKVVQRQHNEVHRGCVGVLQHRLDIELSIWGAHIVCLFSHVIQSLKLVISPSVTGAWTSLLVLQDARSTRWTAQHHASSYPRVQTEVIARVTPDWDDRELCAQYRCSRQGPGPHRGQPSATCPGSWSAAARTSRPSTWPLTRGASCPGRPTWAMQVRLVCTLCTPVFVAANACWGRFPAPLSCHAHLS